jgi:hypothetical protein
MTVIALVTPKPAAKHKLWFNKPTSGAYLWCKVLRDASLGQALAILASFKLEREKHSSL